LEDKHNITDGALHFYLIDRITSSYEQFTQGQQTYGLHEEMQKHATIFKDVLCFVGKKLTSMQIKNLSNPLFSESGSNKRRTEIKH